MRELIIPRDDGQPIATADPEARLCGIQPETLADMEGVLVKRQGEAVSTTVAVDTASVTGCRWWWRACR